jgi:hypothetical protein
MSWGCQSTAKSAPMRVRPNEEIDRFGEHDAEFVLQHIGVLAVA